MPAVRIIPIFPNKPIERIKSFYGKANGQKELFSSSSALATGRMSNYE